MSWSKLVLVKKAFSQIGLASYYGFDVQPEQIQDALSTLEAMMADWNAKGIRSGYSMSSSPEVDGSVDSGLSDSTYLAVICNLALILAAGYGRQVSAWVGTTAKKGYDTLLSLAAHPPEMQLPSNMPAGAGVKTWRSTDRPFLSDPHHGLAVGSDRGLSLRGKRQGH